MTRFFNWLLCWFLYLTGHFIESLFVEIFPDDFYPIYSKLMIWSLNINIKYGFDIWKKVQ